MTARIEQITQTYKEMLESAGFVVYRLKGKATPKNVIEANSVVIKLQQSDLDILGDESQTDKNYYWDLNIKIVIQIMKNEYLDQLANNYFLTIYNLFMASETTRKLSLSYVLDTYCDGMDEPIDYQDAAQPLGEAIVLFRTRFKSPVNSMSA